MKQHNIDLDWHRVMQCRHDASSTDTSWLKQRYSQQTCAPAARSRTVRPDPFFSEWVSRFRDVDYVSTQVTCRCAQRQRLVPIYSCGRNYKIFAYELPEYLWEYQTSQLFQQQQCLGVESCPLWQFHAILWDGAVNAVCFIFRHNNKPFVQ